jgi:hypothetical protein
MNLSLSSREITSAKKIRITSASFVPFIGAPTL